MNRRMFLATVGTVGATGSAGCLTGLFDDTPDHVVLDPPDDQLADSSDLPYPAYGEALPVIDLPDPITGERIVTDDLDGCLVVTAFYAFCPAECVMLISSLTGVQHGTIDRGIDDRVTFLAITFDPERDDENALREHAETMRVDLDAGNWHYLRPADADEAKRVVDEKLGIIFDRDDEGAESGDAYGFMHLTVTFLVNPDGYVERAYRTDAPDVERILSDIESVLDAYDART